MAIQSSVKIDLQQAYQELKQKLSLDKVSELDWQNGQRNIFNKPIGDSYNLYVIPSKVNPETYLIYSDSKGHEIIRWIDL